MAIIKLAFVVYFFYVTFVVADDPDYLRLKRKIIFRQYNFTIAPNNPYYGEWSSEIIPPGDKINVKTPTKKDFPPEMRVKVTSTYNGNIVGTDDLTFCKYLTKYNVSEIIKDYVVPKIDYPITCPIKACEYCEIKNMKFLPEMLPLKLPPSILESHIIVYLDDENAPFFVSDMKIELIYE